MPFRLRLKNVRIRLCLSLDHQTTPVGAKQEHQKLAILVQALALVETAAQTSGVPYLSGAIGFALEVAKCVQGYRANNEGLNRLALGCVKLMLDITKQITIGGVMSENMGQLVEDLFGTLEKVQNTAKNIVNSGTRTRRFLAQKDISERLDGLSKDVTEAQMRFMTLVLIANAQNQEQTKDSIYDHSSIVLGSYYASGDGWIAFNGKLQETGENVIIKRYSFDDASKRRARHEADIKAFKKNWFMTLW
ncbi:hypothetical protein MVEN_00312400 [Mycena venus]|uniref:Uncharacterized protein n=1 Tax=Mycena venus TaxID=2733690 RepID=A0A8H6Z3F7_9AGAR|nr:hypothetical protein MVEN_00312400 [Mycena venus]